MELTPEDVIAILELFERTDVEHLRLEVGGAKLIVDKSSPGPVSIFESVASVAGPAPTVSSEVQVDASPALASVAPSPAEPPAQAHDGASTGLVTITAPVVGVFYRAPEPLAPPYVDVGTHVDVGQTLGLVEVMKMLNSVTSTVRGEVIEVMAKNEEFVEFGQPLVAIRPEFTS